MLNLHKYDPVSLRLFVSCMDAGSLTAGAQHCGISVAAASKRIADLEHHFGLRLLLRGKRGVQATAAGQSLHQHALEVLARLEQMAVSMQDFGSGATGQLRLWANATAFSGFLPAVLARYGALYPGIALDVQDVLSEEAVRAVTTGVAELAIIGENTKVGELHTQVCDEDDLALLLPQGHALARLPAIGLEQALAHDFVSLGRASSLTRQIVAQAQALDMALKIRIQVRGFDAMGQMVAAGLGIALAPAAIARALARRQSVQMRALHGTPLRRRLLLAMRSSAQLSTAASSFVALTQTPSTKPLSEPWTGGGALPS